MRKLSRFLPFFSKAVIHFGVKPRPAQVDLAADLRPQNWIFFFG
jgi:hypothetical protein